MISLHVYVFDGMTKPAVMFNVGQLLLHMDPNTHLFPEKCPFEINKAQSYAYAHQHILNGHLLWRLY